MIKFLAILAVVDLHRQTTAEVSRVYNVSRRTIRGWRVRNRKITFVMNGSAALQQEYCHRDTANLEKLNCKEQYMHERNTAAACVRPGWWKQRKPKSMMKCPNQAVST